jgi:predicted choloylglycine hydrolase
MKTILNVLIVLCLVQLPAHTQTTVSKRALKEITLTGHGYDLGVQHGKMLIKEIADIVTKWKANTERALGKDAETVLKDFFAYADFTPAIKEWTPDLYEEVRGIADGSGQEFHDIFVLNLLDEFWVYIDQLANHHCSDMGVPARNGQPAYIAQNMDIETYTDGYQTLLRIQRDKDQPEQLILTHPGLIALNGMNETGVGTVVNTIMQLKAAPAGLPVAFVVRRIIQTTDKEDLLSFIQEVPHASGQSYILGIREEVYNFEASANKVVRHQPEDENGAVYHTNHPIVNDDVKEWYKQYDPSLIRDELSTSDNSYIRLEAVRSRVGQNNIVTPEVISTALRSKDDPNHPVCRNNTPGKGGFTFASTIMTLSGTPHMSVTAGPPDESAYRDYYFSKN